MFNYAIGYCCASGNPVKQRACMLGKLQFSVEELAPHTVVCDGVEHGKA